MIVVLAHGSNSKAHVNNIQIGLALVKDWRGEWRTVLATETETEQAKLAK